MKSLVMAQSMAKHGLRKPRSLFQPARCLTMPMRTFSTITIPENQMELVIVHVDSHKKGPTSYTIDLRLAS